VGEGVKLADLGSRLAYRLATWQAYTKDRKESVQDKQRIFHGLPVNLAAGSNGDSAADPRLDTTSAQLSPCNSTATPVASAFKGSQMFNNAVTASARQHLDA
jgi:hypothetical protein